MPAINSESRATLTQQIHIASGSSAMLYVNGYDRIDPDNQNSLRIVAQIVIGTDDSQLIWNRKVYVTADPNTLFTYNMELGKLVPNQTAFALIMAELGLAFDNTPAPENT